jgi:DNA polymerase III epsilon subunit-like protein
MKLKHARPVHPDAAAKNGYDPAVWAREAVGFEDFVRWTARHIPFGSVAVPVGHNVAFDMPRIQRAFKARGAFCPFAFRAIDTLTLANIYRLTGMLPLADSRLETVARAIGHRHTAHRALGDAEACMALYQHVVCRLHDGHLARGAALPASS